MDLNLNPTTISLSTFKTLLASYKATVKSKTRSKALAKAPSKGKKQKTQSKKRAADSVQNEGDDEHEDGLSQDVKKQVDAQVKEFEALDEWRYESLPGLVEARIQGKANANADSEEGERKKGDALSKDEVVKLMEWKLYVPPPAPDLLDTQVQFLTKSLQKTRRLPPSPAGHDKIKPRKEYPKRDARRVFSHPAGGG